MLEARLETLEGQTQLQKKIRVEESMVVLLALEVQELQREISEMWQSAEMDKANIESLQAKMETLRQDHAYMEGKVQAWEESWRGEQSTDKESRDKKIPEPSQPNEPKEKIEKTKVSFSFEGAAPLSPLESSSSSEQEPQGYRVKKWRKRGPALARQVQETQLDESV